MAQKPVNYNKLPFISCFTTGLFTRKLDNHRKISLFRSEAAIVIHLRTLNKQCRTATPEPHVPRPVLELKSPKYDLRSSRQNASNSRQTGGFEIYAQKRARLLTGDEPKRDASFHVFPDRVIFIEHLANFRTAHGPTNEQKAARTHCGGWSFGRSLRSGEGVGAGGVDRESEGGQ